ncbi:MULTISPECIES: phosphotransferase family protein [unclassified Nocardioides]|uniref:phosphotransferase family protein n=1 Tax=unclassified Nocardioides TaxID=2615069 RepID=UPI0006F3108B|nr:MULTISPECIES: phosphotransferase family protein [unclassified Nocardioides]KRA38894.1 aminoglycoside phosphotransferase [Nocardioides sp. Root614]KRA92854.1 aminoglycoside phosphotransferase [Nocardioides sp. Root682]
MTSALDPVEHWMDEQGLGHGPLESVVPISGGTQNVMLRFQRAGRSYVLRRGPEHLRPRSNDVIRRECRVLRSLGGTAVQHPALIAACEDESVLAGAVFYLMEPVDGFNASTALPALHQEDAAIRHEMGLRLVDALATLAAVDHVAVGLGDFGKPEGFLERQVPRWLAELASYDAFAEYPGPDIGPVAEVAAWLDAHRPTDWTPGILHGDFHAANVMFSRTGPDVVAVVDWEMCTIGDPLLDLGWLLATWHLPGAPDEFAGPLTRAGGLASPDELVRRYAERSSRDLSAIDWYVVLACFKLGIILEGSHARALAGLAPKDIGDRLHLTTLRLFERAHELIQQS